MGDYSSLENISNSGSANVSLVISESGLAAAQRLESMFGIPYVAGVPIGKAFSEVLSKLLNPQHAETPQILRSSLTEILMKTAVSL